ncbi:MAG: hypothetical protein ACOYEV_16790, partial [Candidatus Nanopelagicales bacterium]
SHRKTSCLYSGEAIDCRGPGGGLWSNAKACWVALADPQSAKSADVWGKHDDGAIYVCTPPAASSTGLDIGYQFWAGTAPTLGDPLIAARRAYDQAREQTAAPRIGLTPLRGSALVGTDTWLWVANTPTAWTQKTATASVPGISVTVTATPINTVWDMGDGNSATCNGPGTPWQVGGPASDPSPDCGYRYLTTSGDTPDGKFTIRATVTWEAAWTGTGGLGGTLEDFTQTSTRTLQVGELQVRRTT